MSRRIDPDQLDDQLRTNGIQSVAPMIIVTGDEPLLRLEAGDSLRSAALAAGYSDRQSLVLDARSDWSEVLAALQNVSLFGDKRLLELAIPTGKPGKTGADTLQKLAALAQGNNITDTFVVLALPRLDKTTRSAKWAQAIFQAAACIDIPSVSRQALPQWIAARLKKQRQTLERSTLEWMADKVEGNLLAAHQEILKLGLVYPEGQISAGDVQRAVLNVARYDVFGLRDAMLAGNAHRALTILAGLKAEGEALPLVFWAVGDEVRVLARLSHARAAGAFSTELRKHRVFGAREQGLTHTLNRVPAGAWPALVQHAHDIDRLIKGLKVPGRLDDPWEELSRLILRLTSGAAARPAN
ncbi:MAG: DNA polymerase III subunit delta [Burkholderiaceae bacterium]|jgi:DNA polymerase-3 subunit delta